jgi:hypothetical protein
VPLTSPGVTTIQTIIQISSGDNLIQPGIYLPFFDIDFDHRVIKFKQKTGYDVPYFDKAPSTFLFYINGVSCPMTIDAGTTLYSRISKKIADKINIERL